MRCKCRVMAAKVMAKVAAKVMVMPDYSTGSHQN